jgi:transcription initiation factor IIE alpha subunit
MKRLSSTEKIYKAFYNTEETELYYNQLKEITKLSDNSIQNALKKLERNREVGVNKQKANTYYSLKNKSLTAIQFTFFDHEKLENLKSSINIPVKKFLSEMPKSIVFIILFGSASRRQER